MKAKLATEGSRLEERVTDQPRVAPHTARLASWPLYGIDKVKAHSCPTFCIHSGESGVLMDRVYYGKRDCSGFIMMHDALSRCVLVERSCPSLFFTLHLHQQVTHTASYADLCTEVPGRQCGGFWICRWPPLKGLELSESVTALRWKHCACTCRRRNWVLSPAAVSKKCSLFDQMF